MDLSGVLQGAPRPRLVTFDRLIQAYLAQRQREGVTASTLVLCTRWLTLFANFCREHQVETPLWLTPPRRVPTQPAVEPAQRRRVLLAQHNRPGAPDVRACLSIRAG